MSESKKKNRVKVKPARQYTRMQAERAIASGALPPERFLDMSNPLAIFNPKKPDETVNHPNYHTRRKAWFRMGCPVMPNAEDHAKLMKDLRIKEKVVEAPVVLGDEATAAIVETVSEEQPS
jgi:hypothetical protein